MKRIPGGVTAPRGFLATGLCAGIKEKKPDLALIYSKRPAAAAGVTTTNRMCAAPIHLVRPSLKAGAAQAILANSGNANCCTGPQGMSDAKTIRRQTAKLLGLEEICVLVASTGVIGKSLPTRKILKALPKLVDSLSSGGSQKAARAILTTDLIKKSVAVSFQVQGKTLKVGGIAKGSGMIDPAMATMLCFITTDAKIPPRPLAQALREATAISFNSITVDGQMSTNDAVFLLANGAAENQPLSPGQPGWKLFTGALKEVTRHLARAIVHDGEGATRYLSVKILGAKTGAQALQLAKQLANAPLIKTMVRGKNPNWGRLAATVGATSLPFNPNRIEIRLGGIPVFRRGAPLRVKSEKLKEKFKRLETQVSVDLKTGRATAEVYTCDLSEGYVRINAKYS